MENQSVVAPPKTPQPTTYIQADATDFKELVQKLTGAGAGSAPPHKLRPMAAVQFKLQERRKHSVRDLDIIKRGVELLSSAKCSPAVRRKAGFPSPVEGPETPLRCDSVSVGMESPATEEERAIAEKGFYLHSSPAKAEPPVLLTLFPLSSQI